MLQQQPGGYQEPARGKTRTNLNYAGDPAGPADYAEPFINKDLWPKIRVFPFH